MRLSRNMHIVQPVLAYQCVHLACSFNPCFFSNSGAGIFGPVPCVACQGKAPAVSASYPPATSVLVQAVVVVRSGSGCDRFVKLSLHISGLRLLELLEVRSGVLLVARGVPDCRFDGRKPECYGVAFGVLLLISTDRFRLPCMHVCGEFRSCVSKLIEGEAFQGHVVT